MLTEQEAKTKWCPMARVLHYGIERAGNGDAIEFPAAAINRFSGPYDGEGNETVLVTGSQRCLASSCMMWRLEYTSPNAHGCDNPQARIEPPRPAEVPADWEWHPHSDADYNGARWVEPAASVEARRKGFCSLGAGTSF